MSYNIIVGDECKRMSSQLIKLLVLSKPDTQSSDPFRRNTNHGISVDLKYILPPVRSYPFSLILKWDLDFWSNEKKPANELFNGLWPFRKCQSFNTVVNIFVSQADLHRVKLWKKILDKLPYISLIKMIRINNEYVIEEHISNACKNRWIFLH